MTHPHQHHVHGPHGSPICARSSIVVKLRLGEAPEHVPNLIDVGIRFHAPADRLDGGPIDRIVSTHAGAVRAAQLHVARANATLVGARNQGYDAVEQMTGLARTYLLRVPAGTPIAELCDRLAQLSTVESVSPNYLAGTLLDFERTKAPDNVAAWAPRSAVRMAEALAIEPGDPAVLVGLIDSGIVPRHPELAGVFRAGWDTVRLQPRDVGPGMQILGENLQDDDDPTDDYVGHGMACAGIIGAVGRAIPQGMAGETQIIPMRALGAVRVPGKEEALGLGAICDLDMAMKLCIDLGARVINMSFGSDDRMLHPASPRPHRDVVDYARSRGCILVAASGNNGIETRYWPAAYPDVITVGATTDTGEVAAFTTRGDHVDLCAPGERIVTTALDSYQLATGTSFAAPFVAGAAALLVSHASRYAHALDGAAVRDLLRQTARPFPTPTRGCGTGQLDAAAALERLRMTIAQARARPGGRHAA